MTVTVMKWCFFCSICSCWEKEESLLAEHMRVAHDLTKFEESVAVECIEADERLRVGTRVKVFRYKIIDPENVCLVTVCEKRYCRVTVSVSMKALVAVPGTVNLSQYRLTSDELESVHSNEEKREEDPWNEVDESELCAGTLDTLYSAPDFVEDFERDKVMNLASGESNQPLSVFKHEYCEELAYPGIFCGEARANDKERCVPVYYSDICKSELRRADHRVAQCVENIFFKLKKLQLKIVLGKCQVALRKHKSRGRSLTAGDLKKEGALDKLVHLDEGYRFLRALRGSPPYFELGPATLFCSFSAAETKWNHMLRILGELLDKKSYSNTELNDMTWEEKCRLIQGDPVTCARHFDFQVQQLILKFLMSDCAPLGRLQIGFTE